MKRMKKILFIMLIFLLVFYYEAGTIKNNITYAANTSRYRDSDLSKLNNTSYPGILAKIKELQTKHPNWSFTILYTGLDWETVIAKETTALHGRSLVQNSGTAWICPVCGKKTYDNGTWYCASSATVKYYMDVRNWLSEEYIFAFETLSYDSENQTIEGVEAILEGTFMDKDVITYTDTEGKTKTIKKSYAQVIMEVAKENNISPYHLASRIRQEQGATGDSPLISGKSSYKDSEGNSLMGYYNYFNVCASGSSEKAICVNGLTYAKKNNWTTPELAIKGGAKTIADEYINNYQDCLYLEKYQVDSAGGLYTHQYMQNVSAPYSEGKEVYNAYKDIDVLDNNFNFIIPVYENMPNTISATPTATMTIVTENVKVSTTSSSLPLRIDMSTSATKLIDLPKDTVILRIEKAKTKSGGYYWDKVIYDTGKKIYIGYVNSEYLTKIDDVITTNISAITNDEVNLRNGPGLSGTTVIKTLSSKTNVTIIDKIAYKIDDYIWYRVKLSDGTQGYMAAKYLTEQNNVVTTDNYKIENESLVIAPGTTLNDIKGATNQGSTFGTGTTILLENESYTLVILGDTNGDGKINSADLLKIVKHLNETAKLTNAYSEAADCNNDGKINSADLLKIVKYLKDQSSITI